MLTRTFSATCFLVVFFVASSAPSMAQADDPPAFDADLEAAVDSIAQAALRGNIDGAPRVAGLAIGIAHDGESVFERGYGLADRDNETAMEAGHIFRIGSITKPFTAAAVLRLVEEGRLSLDDDIRDYLPEAPTYGERVTVRQLLNHTSGIPSYTSQPNYMERSAETLSHAEMLEWITGDSLDFAPGSSFQYNNSGYYLLGLLIEEITGQTYAEHLQEVFFEPLGMERTLYCPDEPDGRTHARGYRPLGISFQEAPPVSMTQPYAAGALCSSVGDLLRWRAALDSGEVLSEDMLRNMAAKTVTSAGDTTNYGFGLSVGERDGHRGEGHGGGIHGFVTQWIHFPDDGWTVTVLTNTEGPAAYRVEEAVTRQLLGIPEPEIADLELSPEERAVYVGTYDIQVLHIRIFEQDGRLMAQGTGQSAFPIRAQGAHEFRAGFDPSVRLVFTVEAGQAQELTLHQGGQSFSGPRVDDE